MRPFLASYGSYNLRMMLGWAPRALKHSSAGLEFPRRLNVQDDCRMRANANGSVCIHVFYMHIYMLIYISATVPQAHRAFLIQCRICKLLKKKGVEDSLLLKGNHVPGGFTHFTCVAFLQ